MIQMNAASLRRAAALLEQLAEIEQGTGIRFDGAYNGHVMVSIQEDAGEDPGAVESLRLVRRPDLEDGSPAGYALEFEVP